MSTIAKSSIATLRRRADDLFATISTKFENEAKELKLLLEIIHQREQSTGSDFIGVRSPRRAIELCLAERGGPMTKAELLDRLVDGGFVKNKDLEKWLINDSVNQAVRKGQLVLVGDGEKWAAAVDLPQRAQQDQK